MKQSKVVAFSPLAAALCFCAGLLALGLTSCKGFFSPINLSGTTSTTGDYAYVINTGGTLAEYSLSTTGLSSLTGSPITLPVAGTAIAVSPNNAFAYVGTSTGVFLYTIGSDGALTEGNSNQIIYINQNIVSPVVQSMVVDQTNSWLIMAYQNSTEIDALPIDPTSGLPTGAAVQTANVKSATATPQVVISKANAQVFVAMGAGGTEEIDFTPKSTDPWGTTGTLITTLSANNSATSVAVDPTSTYLFIAEANNTTAASTAGTVRMIATADLTATKDLSDQPTGIGPSSVLADLSGAYVYVANETDGTVSNYAIDVTTKSLNPVSTSSSGQAVTTLSEQSPIALAEDNSKSYILNIGNQANPDFWVYAFDSSTAGLLDIKTTTSTGGSVTSVANGIATTH